MGCTTITVLRHYQLDLAILRPGNVSNIYNRLRMYYQYIIERKRKLQQLNNNEDTESDILQQVSSSGVARRSRSRSQSTSRSAASSRSRSSTPMPNPRLK